MITSKKLRSAFKSEWPELTQVWLRNKKYIKPGLEDLKAVVSLYVSDLPVITGVNECENFALYLHSAVKKHCVENETEFNWAFGDFICKKEDLFFGTVTHTACICLCEDGFYIIEPMENNKVLKTNKNYKPFFINLM